MRIVAVFLFIRFVLCQQSNLPPPLASLAVPDPQPTNPIPDVPPPKPTETVESNAPVQPTQTNPKPDLPNDDTPKVTSDVQPLPPIPRQTQARSQPAPPVEQPKPTPSQEEPKTQRVKPEAQTPLMPKDTPVLEDKKAAKEKSSGVNIGLIVGVVIGGVCLIVAAIVFYCIKIRKKDTSDELDFRPVSFPPDGQVKKAVTSNKYLDPTTNQIIREPVTAYTQPAYYQGAPVEVPVTGMSYVTYDMSQPYYIQNAAVPVTYGYVDPNQPYDPNTGYIQQAQQHPHAQQQQQQQQQQGHDHQRADHGVITTVSSTQGPQYVIVGNSNANVST
jgi:hypothetical protein